VAADLADVFNHSQFSAVDATAKFDNQTGARIRCSASSLHPPAALASSQAGRLKSAAG
jgi:hypothetical protein